MRSKMKITDVVSLFGRTVCLQQHAVRADVGASGFPQDSAHPQGECRLTKRPRRYSQADRSDRILRVEPAGLGKTFAHKFVTAARCPGCGPQRSLGWDAGHGKLAG